MSIPELASLLGIHPARFSKHLSTLQDISALSWRTKKSGKVVLSFPVEPIAIAENLVDTQNPTGSAMLSSMEREVPGPQSYFPQQIMGYLTNQDDPDEFLQINDPVDSDYLKKIVERCFINS